MTGPLVLPPNVASVKLSRASVEQLLDVVDCKLSSMDIVDREDQRCFNALTDAQRALEAALPKRPRRTLARPNR